MVDVWYAVVDGSDALISTGTVIADDATLAELGYAAIVLPGDPTGMLWNPSTRSFDPAPQVPNTYSKLEFIRRFTADEFMAFKGSSDAEIRFFMYQLEHSTSVVPQDQTVQTALAYAASLGLLTPARAISIGAN